MFVLCRILGTFGIYVRLISPFSLSASVAQLYLPPTDVEVAGSDLRRVHSFEIDHEIFSTVILSLLLIQGRQLSVSGERMCLSTG